ncbi:uncharacterized membrane protein C3orf80 homolog [Poecilia latipinna]|nr:PREDICTED: uncharacterized membrane protein C3orf80 homolog [Poecilia latipinna]XP_016525699.1 PREDICTED: uncharacterized membrane protein C3orf80 homolog [Poecilia formosa]
MKPRLLGGGRTTRRLLSACLISVCQALHSCGGVKCVDGHQCCLLPVPGNGSSGSAESCCKLPIHVFFDNVGWFTRKLSGILILLLLFAMGYFIQRIICPRPRHRHQNQEHGEEPSLFHGPTSASQDLLLEPYPECTLGDFASPNLPAYDEVKYLPTYEESMQEMHRDRDRDRDRSDDDLLSGAEPAAAESGQQRRDLLGVSPARTARNSV